MTLLAVVTLFVLLLSGLPVAFSLGLAGLFLLYLMVGPNALAAVPQMMFVAVDSFTLMSVPFFILAADVLVRGGVTNYLIEAVEKLFGHLRGGLATVSVIACAFFAAISGSSSATAVAIGSVLAPEMIKRGYNSKYTLGIIAVAGGLGILIPPSIPMIVYGTVAEQSVGKLFLAGVIPGIILTLALVLTGMIVFGRDQASRRVKRAPWREQGQALKKAFWVLLLPVLIAWTIYGGIATPTEAAGMSVVYAFLCSLVIYRGLKPKDIIKTLGESAGSSAMILLIIGGATVFGYVLTMLQVPQKVTAAVLAGHLSPVAFLLIVNGILLVLGCFLDITSILLLTSPIFLPIMRQLGIDPIHFAVIFVINMELALITPPLGMNLFILSGITRERIEKVLWGALPFALVMLAVLLLVTYVPKLSLLLVR
ncbi:MAG: TRAP transporter large permease [Armatimonadetes bacterium]|nr:TRAP transporter large permease [Armatimonadota bacterium]